MEWLEGVREDGTRERRRFLVESLGLCRVSHREWERLNISDLEGKAKMICIVLILFGHPVIERGEVEREGGKGGSVLLRKGARASLHVIKWNKRWKGD